MAAEDVVVVAVSVNAAFAFLAAVAVGAVAAAAVVAAVAAACVLQFSLWAVYVDVQREWSSWWWG